MLFTYIVYFVNKEADKILSKNSRFSVDKLYPGRFGLGDVENLRKQGRLEEILKSAEIPEEGFPEEVNRILAT